LLLKYSEASSTVVIILVQWNLETYKSDKVVSVATVVYLLESLLFYVVYVCTLGFYQPKWIPWYVFILEFVILWMTLKDRRSKNNCNVFFLNDWRWQWPEIKQKYRIIFGFFFSHNFLNYMYHSVIGKIWLPFIGHLYITNHCL
jgi:hypothetical protein